MQHDLTAAIQCGASFSTWAATLLARRGSALSTFVEVARRCRPYDVAASQLNHPIVHSVGKRLRPVTISALLQATGVPDTNCAIRMALGFPNCGYIERTHMHKHGYVRATVTCFHDHSAWHARLVGSMRKRGAPPPAKLFKTFMTATEQP